MALFKKKDSPQPSHKPHKNLQEIAHERVLTDEGWRRKQIKKTGKPTVK